LIKNNFMALLQSRFCNSAFMKEALNQAFIAFEKDEVPVGAVIVENGKIIAASHNQNLNLSDPTAHAEILVLRQAAKIKNSSRLDECDIYVTLEPCSMCASAISLARIKRVYYAASDQKFGAVENGVRVFSGSSCHHKPEVYSGIFEEESKKMLQDFFKSKR
jgi:tRNA(Arg) A34 adenosine deaminase TadA